MSEKELALRLLEHVPAHRLGYVIAYLQGITAAAAADDLADDEFCEALLQAYEADPEKGQTIPLAEMLKLSEANPDAV